MRDWAQIYITLLINIRWSNILNESLQILNGLASFYADIIGAPERPSANNKTLITLFLLKLYLSNTYLKTNDIVDYLETPVNEILLIGTKLLLKLETTEEAENQLSKIEISDFDSSNKLQKTFVSETLLNFDQILRITLLDIRRFNKEKSKQASAAQNLKFLKFTMKSREINKVTKETAIAIDKAAENIAKTNSSNLQTNLRLSNLERNLRKHEQKSNKSFKKTHQEAIFQSQWPLLSIRLSNKTKKDKGKN